MSDKTVSLALVGDLMCGDSFFSIGNGVASSLDSEGVDFLAPEIVSLFKDHHVVLCNVEAVLSDVHRNEKRLRELHMHGRAETAGYLGQWGITHAHMANNHIVEHGEICKQDTADQLTRAGVKPVCYTEDTRFEGCGNIVHTEIDGCPLSFVGMCAIEDQYAYRGTESYERLIDVVRSLKEEGRWVIVSLHWGVEFMDQPTREQRDIASRLVDAGASVVAGHHPHVVQGVEMIGDSLVAYSLGDFIFDSYYEDSRWSMILSLDITEGRVRRVEYVPTHLMDNHAPALAHGEMKSRLLSEIDRRNHLLSASGPDWDEAGYLREAELRDQKQRKEQAVHILKKLPKIKIGFWHQIVQRPLLRRTGRW